MHQLEFYLVSLLLTLNRFHTLLWSCSGESVVDVAQVNVGWNVVLLRLRKTQNALQLPMLFFFFLFF